MKDILRFITAGSVDDGKSTLIGRLLYDSHSIFDDQLEAIERASRQKNNDEIDLALLTDGLKAEREQGITIDVAYKYFHTPKRKFIIADTPGHVQYTRNMFTGASNCELAIILIDARHGVIEQTRRHSFLCHLLGIKHFVVAINKMDLVDYSEDRFYEIVREFAKITEKINVPNINFIPISALKGDNVVSVAQENMPWYSGSSLLEFLEEIDTDTAVEMQKDRFQVQYVIRPQTDELHDYRGYAGTVLSGCYSVGDEIMVQPSGLTSRIRSIEIGGKPLLEAQAGRSITILLEDDIDISRGDWLVKASAPSQVTRQIEADICWMDTQALDLSNKYILQKQSRTVRCLIKDILHRIDIQTLGEELQTSTLTLNDIARIRLRTAEDLLWDSYDENPQNGAFILIDEHTNQTVAAGMCRAV
ncbi:MAG: GTP-binding protein [Bernardetiaceae bacterium]|nr:GTP-binding protein [Bernardetiaceae bacterium]